MRTIKRAGIAGVIAAAVVLAGSILPAQASTPAFRQVFSHHYGPANDYSGFTSVVALGKNNVWALGGTDLSGGGTTQQPVIVHWGGKAWTGNEAPAGVPGYVASASADSASDIWAVTFYGGDVLHYNGEKWSVAEKLPVPGASGLLLTDVVAISPKNVWVFGNSGFGPGLGTWHFDGTTWRHETTAALGDTVGTASAVSASNIWGVGASSVAPSAEIQHFNGRSWSPVSNSLLTGLTFNGIRALSASNIWATAEANGGTARTYLLHYGNHWSRVLIPWGLRVVSDVTSDGGSGLWFTGLDSANHQYLVHWLPGNKWQRSATSSTAHIDGLANISGSTSEVAEGFSVLPKAGSNASAWVSGTL
jgi:hypothetical protein